jgi:hypothetical protein
MHLSVDECIFIIRRSVFLQKSKPSLAKFDARFYANKIDLKVPETLNAYRGL